MDVLGEVVGQRPAADGLDDHPDPVGADAVLPHRAGIVHQRCAEALLATLERVGEVLLGAVGVELLVEEVVAAAGRVVHQLPDGGLRPGRAQHRLTALEAVEHLKLAELGHDRRDGRVELYAPLLDELQRCGARDRLGHRRVAEHGVGLGLSGCTLVEDAVAADHCGGDPVQRPVGGHAGQQVVDALESHLKLLCSRGCVCRARRAALAVSRTAARHPIASLPHPRNRLRHSMVGVVRHRRRVSMGSLGR